MSRRSAVPPELAEWIIRSLDGRIAPQEFARLDHELKTNEAALQYYLEFVWMSTGLVDRVGVLPRSLEKIAGIAFGDVLSVAPEEGTGREPLRCSSPGAEEEKQREIEAYAQRQLKAFLRQEHRGERQESYRTPGWDFRDAACAAADVLTSIVRAGTKMVKAAAVCALVVVLVIIGYQAICGDQTVATVVETIDARWAEPLEPGARLIPQSLRLQQGYARIQFERGAEVIVQAPAAFALRTGNEVYLQSGSMAAEVPERARGFRIDSPGSRVVDYGTAFGVLVDGKRRAEVHVFTGKVGVGLNEAAETQTPVLLTEGQAIVVDEARQITRGLVKDRPRLFARSLPVDDGFAVPGRRLSLADIVGGGNGFNTGTLRQGIEPGTGAVLTPSDRAGMSTARFAPVAWSSYIDGTFVLDSRDGPPVITSTGVVFESCPVTSGRCGDAIANGAMFRAAAIDLHKGILTGRVYGSQDSPSLGVPPNARISFDLNGIRSSMPGVRVEAFQSLCGLSATLGVYDEARRAAASLKVTFWVVVDGSIRFAEEVTAVPLMAKWIDIPLGPRDRFLTLAVTCAEESVYAWSLFAEPALKLGIE